MPNTEEVKMTPSYEVENGLWVDVNGVYHICSMKDGHLCEDTLCGIKKIGYGREWGYRLTRGQIVCSTCVSKGKYSNRQEMNMQDYKLVLIKKKVKK